MKVLFLYSELADYFLKCCEALAVHCEVFVVRWPVNREAPFRFSFPPGVTVYEKGGQRISDLTGEIRPDMIVCSGWMDRDYLSALKAWNKRTPVVLIMDTQWRGSLRQWLACLLSPLFITSRFTHAWVPGLSQEKYALRLGFPQRRTHLGFYCCDLERFNSVYRDHHPFKSAAFPRRFIYVGRYFDFKGLNELWEAFSAVPAAERNGWELWCVGTGSLRPPVMEGVRHFGFVQPEDLPALLGQAGVFVMPSRYEPWGVVVQEMAASGFPLLLSDQVGARETFLEAGKNGFRFPARNAGALRDLLKKVMALTDKELILMADHSHQLAQRISPQKWAHTALSIGNERNK